MQSIRKSIGCSYYKRTQFSTNVTTLFFWERLLTGCDHLILSNSSFMKRTKQTFMIFFTFLYLTSTLTVLYGFKSTLTNWHHCCFILCVRNIWRLICCLLLENNLYPNRIHNTVSQFQFHGKKCFFLSFGSELQFKCRHMSATFKTFACYASIFYSIFEILSAHTF